MSYNKVNNIVGWAIFGIAFIVYLLTMAPTASFWDCGEFIACANELEVPHPPGAPFFLILGRFFAMFASSPETVAWWVNMVSVLSGAFCVLFVFWAVTHLAKKMVAPDEKNPGGQKLIAIMSAGIVGGLTCCFADSIWFNSVEAEVYAMSSFFTAIVVWLMFKWEARADEPDNLKWIVLIAFVMGISIGVHLLNLLTVPALAFIYYFKKFKINPVGIIVTFVLSVVILAVIQYGLIQTSVEIAWGFEQFFTGTERMGGTAASNTGMGLPFGTGLTIFLTLTLVPLIISVVATQSDRISAWLYRAKAEEMGIGMKILARLAEYTFGLPFALWRLFNNNTYKGMGLEPRVVVNTICWSIIMIVIGYSSYTMIMIRANAGTPINENDPGSIASMLSYLKREQYGDRPLFRGVRYNDLNQYNQVLVKERKAFVNLREPRPLPDGTYPLESGGSMNVKGGLSTNFNPPAGDGDRYEGELKDGRKFTINRKTKEVGRVEDRYLWSDYKQDVDYTRGKVLFPRMHSGQGNHYGGEYGYKQYTSRLGPTDSPYDDKPSMMDDFRFFLDYQVRHMYLRYFMWNFAGREGDVQDMGWESGWEMWETKHLPAELNDHPGKNHYYLLPLLLGLFGMVFHFVKNSKDATSVMLLFFFTGIAIIIYLNQTPYQPRERDYSYAGSFQTFAMWVGLGVIGLYELLKDILKGLSGYVSGIVSIALVPCIMGMQNWDDHTRALRYVAPDSAYNLLNSCEKNAILFTNGDNDTFPLWYIQEVEGIRTDVRVVNLSLLNTDWYIDQMKQQQNESPPLPISAKQSEYIGDKNSIRGWERGRKLAVPVDKAAVIANGTVKPEYKDIIVSPLEWAVGTRGGAQRPYLLKQDWLILDILLTNASNGWERPIYFSSTIPPSSYIKLQPFFQVEGLANRVVPVDFTKLPQRNDPYGRQGRVDTEMSYDKLMNVFKFRELNNPDLYIDDHIRRTIVGNTVSMIFRTANAFADDADNLKLENERMKLFEKSLDSATVASSDSVMKILAANKTRMAANEKKITEYQKKAEDLLLMSENTFTDKARGYDVIYPMFAGGVWERIGNMDKMKEYFEKVLLKAEAWVNYKVARDQKLKDHDRIISTMSFLMNKAREIKDYSMAARAADLLYLDSGNQQYKEMGDQFRKLMPATEGTPTDNPVQPVQPAPVPAPNN